MIDNYHVVFILDDVNTPLAFHHVRLKHLDGFPDEDKPEEWEEDEELAEFAKSGCKIVW